MAKQYGLVLPKKDKSHKIGEVSSTKPSIFNEDSDSDTPKTSVAGVSKNTKKQDQLIQDKAALEDPTVYQYDEVYDELDQKRKESKLARKDLDRKPKYISKLIEAADKRKRENERRIERQVQKEREEEGDQFKDKESFITSAYKKKLEEMKELEEQEKREEYLESIGDVKKQGNLDGFYRHLYDQKINFEEKENDKSKTEIKAEEPSGDKESKEETKLEDLTTDSQAEDEDKSKPKKDSKKRKYRQHKQSDDEEPEIKKEHLPSNLDADSDFDIDSDSGDDCDEKTKAQIVDSVKKQIHNKINQVFSNAEYEVAFVTPEGKKIVEIISKKGVRPKKPKKDIWKKQTVGEAFDDALKRYFERKSYRDIVP